MISSIHLNVFQYWGQGLEKMPLFLKTIYKHNLELCRKNNINLVLLDDNNIFNYIKPHPRFETLAFNFKSDMIRYYVLHKYGGFWFDTDVIIIKNLNNLHTLKKYECMLDIEYDTKIGCASLFIKKQSISSRFCIDYINNILNNKSHLSWGDIGPDTSTMLYKKHKRLILLNNGKTVSEGCNFICWNISPGLDKKDWYLSSRDKAKAKADMLKNNSSCYYLITWSIYKKNDMGSNLNNIVFNDEKSVFSYFMKNEVDLKKVIVKNAIDNELNGEYIEKNVLYKDKGSISYVKDDNNHLYLYNGIWRLGNNGIKKYINIGNKLDKEVDLNKNIIIYSPKIDGNVISCKINFIGKEIIIKNEYFGIDNLYNGVEGFVSLFIPQMLLTNTKIIIKDEICKTFYDNLLKLKKYYETLNIGTIYFNIECKISETQNIFHKRGKLSTFTGGVDSFYTLLTNLHKIDTLLYCINYDIQESKQKLLEQQLKTVRGVAQKLGKKVILCRTNQRNVLEWGNIGYLTDIKKKYNNDLWGYFLHGVCLFSNAYNLSSEYNEIFIPSNDIDYRYRLWGTSFEADHLYGSSFLDICHDGQEYRCGKVKKLIDLNRRIVFDYLKVCFSNTNQLYNCSKCEKCNRTLIIIYSINPDYLKELKTFNTQSFIKIKDNFLKSTSYIFQSQIKKLLNQNSGVINVKKTDNKCILTKKKYAVLWASTENIGDDIQTLAAINFLKKKSIFEYSYIDREKLSEYNGEPVTLIMNGWFMHNIDKFPPSDKITPIFISTHIQNENIVSKNISYFKKYEPIGCRDQETVNLFEKYNIDAYFTGCLTLLFDDNQEKKRGKYLVDVNTKCYYIPNIVFDSSKYNDFEVINHKIDIKTDIKSRLYIAEELLNKYKTAEQIITTRLHCILPCRAFNTHAIFIHKNYNSDKRFSGLKNIINGDTKEHTNKDGNRDEIKKIRNICLSLVI